MGILGGKPTGESAGADDSERVTTAAGQGVHLPDFLAVWGRGRAM